MGKELIFSRMVIPTLESIKKVSQTAKGNTRGRMVLSMLESSDRDSSMEKAVGKVQRVLNQVINMKAIILTIRNMATVCLPGQVAILTKVSIKRMSEMATEK